MKNTKRFSRALFSALAALVASAAQAQSDAAKATLLLSLTAYDNAVGGIVDGVADGHQSNAASFSVGELDDASYTRLERGILVFGLPAIPKDKRLLSATLRLHVRVSGTDGEATVYHSRQQNRQVGASEFYGDPTYSDLVGVAATPSVSGTNEKPVPVELEVTRWVEADYQSDFGTIVSSFRIQIDDLAFAAGGGSNRYSFLGKSAQNPDYAPVLDLKFAPRAP